MEPSNSPRRIRLSANAMYARCVAAALTFFQLTHALFALPERLGDLNQNGEPDILDIVMLYNHLSGSAPLNAELVEYANVNSDYDGADPIIDDIDANLIADAILGAGGYVLPRPRQSPTVQEPEEPSTNGDTFEVVANWLPNQDVRVMGGNTDVTIQSGPDGLSATTVDLKSNARNRIFVTGFKPGGEATSPKTIEVVQDSQAPELFIDFPADGATLTNPQVTIAGRVSDLLSGFMGLEVNVNGEPAIVNIGIGTNGTFERPAVPLALGENTITASATDEVGNTIEKSITLTRVEATGPQMEVVSGDGQSGRISELLAEPIVVRVTKEDGSPFAGKLVRFDVTRSDGQLRATSDLETDGGLSMTARTDADGLAQAWWRLGMDAGCGNNRVAVTSLNIAGTVFFCASANPAPPVQINIGTGNMQKYEAGAPAPDPLVAWVNDTCNGVPDVPVTFRVVSGGGTVNGRTSAVVNSSQTGHTEALFTLGAEPGLNRVEATIEGLEDSPAVFVLEGVARRTDVATGFTGLVVDNADTPIGGARCALEVDGGAYITTTNDSGRFSFVDVTPGPGHLRVDGLVATTVGGEDIPQGSYPSLYFEVILVPDIVNSLPSPIKLPELNPANARVYDGTRDVVLTCEGIAGLRMTIFAGSMTRADGTIPSVADPAILSLNQVHHDDIPMPMPDGAAPPFAWTLQPSEARFDPPVQVEYPNMSGLAPGAIAFFLQYDHATEAFEIYATGSVDEEGLSIITDPGDGLPIAGWGCNCPPYAASGSCGCP